MVVHFICRNRLWQLGNTILELELIRVWLDTFCWLHQAAVEAPEIRENGKVKVDDAPEQPSNGNIENGVKNDVKNDVKINDDNENDDGSLEPEDAEEHTLLKPGNP